jgi:hypothetical protein
VERSRDWMDQAEGDLRHAKSDLEGAITTGPAFPPSRRQAGRLAS